MNQMTRIVAGAEPDFIARFTTVEFLDMADMGAFGDWKVELVEGELHRMPPPGNGHSRLQASIIADLAITTAKALVRGETGIDLGNNTLLGFDAALLRGPVTDRQSLLPGDVALVVEIAETTLERDLGMKRRRYAAAGVPVYWVVDSPRAVIHVHADPIEGGYSQIRTVRFGETLEVPGTDRTIVID